MKSLSILVVDDHEIMRDVVCQILEDCGHEVALASDGGDALDLLGATHFDVLVTDIVMRQMDGIELIHEVRRRFPAMRILAMSGGGERFPIVDGLEIATQAGAGAVLRKPFRADELRDTLAHLCHESTLAVS
jgi:CheY-like chemotaxis protein